MNLAKSIQIWQEKIRLASPDLKSFLSLVHTARLHAEEERAGVRNWRLRCRCAYACSSSVRLRCF